MSRRDWPDTLELQDRLNTHLLQGRRSTILLNKHIRRLKSVKAYILNEKAKVKTELTDYVNRLLESLLDFRSEVLQQLDDVVKNKFEELSMIKTGLEEDIDTLSTLCEETEKLLQFDSEIRTRTDLHRAETLEKAFRMLKSQGDPLEIENLLSLKFTPSLDVDHLNCKAFGTLYPSVNESEEDISGTNSNSPLRNLNCSKNTSSSNTTGTEKANENVSNCSRDKSLQVDINSNLATTVCTDINLNVITNSSQTERESSYLSGLDPAELAAYINELNLAQANNNLAFRLSQLHIQNIPLPEGNPPPVDLHSVFTATPTQDTQVLFPSQPFQTTLSATATPQTLVTATVPVQNTLTTPTLTVSSNKSMVFADEASESMNSSKSAKTQSPPGFKMKCDEKDVSTQTEEAIDGESKGLSYLTKIDNKVETVMTFNDHNKNLSNATEEHDIVSDEKKEFTTEKAVKSKTYLREAKLKVGSLGLKEKELKEMPSNNDTEIVKIEIKPHDFVNSRNKLERGLNDLEDSSDEENLVSSSDAEGEKETMDCRQSDGIYDSQFCQKSGGKLCLDPVTEATAADVNVEETSLPDIKHQQSGKTVKITTGDPVFKKEMSVSAVTKEGLSLGIKHSSHDMKETDDNVTMKDPSSSIESFLKKTLKIEPQPLKPLRRPLSHPRIPFKSQKLTISLLDKENHSAISQGIKDTCINSDKADELKSEDTRQLDDTTESSAVEKDKETKDKDSTLVTEEEKDTSVSLQAAGNYQSDEKTVDLGSVSSGYKSTYVDCYDYQEGTETKNTEKGHDENVVECVHKDSEDQDRTVLGKQRMSEVYDKMTASEKNIDMLISQTAWCKNYIQKTLSPKLNKKNGMDSARSDITTHEDSNQVKDQGLPSHNNGENKTKTEKSVPQSGLADRESPYTFQNKTLSKSFESALEEKTVISRRPRASSASYTSESWDAELDDCTNSGTQMDSSGNATSALDKNRDALVSQAAWCKKYIHNTLTSTPKTKSERNTLFGSTDTSGDGRTASIRTSLDNIASTKTVTCQDRVSNSAVDTDIANKSDNLDSRANINQGMTVIIPIQDVKQISMPVSEPDSWDSECESDANNNMQSDKSVVVLPVPQSIVQEKTSIEAPVHSQHCAGQCTKEASILETYRRGKRRTALKATQLTTVGSLGKGSSSGLFFPIGVTSNSFGDIIITDTGNNLVKWYDKNGKFVKSFGQQCDPPLRRPSAVVVNDKSDIFVKDDICIRKFRRTGSLVGDFGMKVFVRPYGLAIIDEGILIVLETNYRNPSLVHMTENGGIIKEYPYQPLQRAPVNSKCRFMAVSGGTVIVSDLGLSQVYLTDLQGCFLQVIGRYGRGPMDFVEPSGVAADRFGNCIVGDSRNNKIKVWQCDGTFLGVVELSDEIVRPSGIHLTCDNKLLVTNYILHQVKVYQLEF